MVSDKFKAQFYNDGIMMNGKVYTSKVSTDCDEVFPLKKIIQHEEIDKKFFLSDEAYKKYEYLKGNKRIPRVKPNGEKYFYTEGAMPCPDNLDALARTMLTSEGGISRTTHIVEDYKTKKIRLLTPIEYERINFFPNNLLILVWLTKKETSWWGNALFVGLIERIGNELEKIIEKED